MTDQSSSVDRLVKLCSTFNFTYLSRYDGEKFVIGILTGRTQKQPFQVEAPTVEIASTRMLEFLSSELKDLL
jgi:hypothetical protein